MSVSILREVQITQAIYLYQIASQTWKINYQYKKDAMIFFLNVEIKNKNFRISYTKKYTDLSPFQEMTKDTEQKWNLIFWEAQVIRQGFY